MNFALSENPNCNETYASFRLEGDRVDPVHITKLIGITPRFSYTKGELFVVHHDINKELRRPRGIWGIDSRDDVLSTSLEKHLLFLINLLEPKITLIKELMVSQELNAEFNAYWISETGMGGPVLSPSILLRIANFDAYLDFEFQGPFWD